MTQQISKVRCAQLGPEAGGRRRAPKGIEGPERDRGPRGLEGESSSSVPDPRLFSIPENALE